ncbi:MAG: hypothetical protein V7L05_25620 [Nostoc sp.]|uniref:hypothetical protein n=1 Tax=Nostoc sp. TaxID=1180 RepID=UPI002FFC79A2
MVIQGFSFSAYLAIPVALSLFAKGERIKVYLAENVRQVSTNKKIILSNRELISTNATPKTVSY